MQLYGIFKDSYFSSVQLTKDNGYIAGGGINCTGDWSGDPFLVKVNSVGDTMWTKTFIDTFPHFYANVIKYLIETSDTNYIVVGVIGSYGWIAKITPQQNILWNRVFSRDTIESYFFSIIETDDKNCFVGGYMGNMNTRYDAWLVKISLDGDTLWTKTFGKIEIDESIFDICKTQDNNYVLAGMTQEFSPPYYSHAWLYKLNNSGDSIWMKDYKDSLDYQEIHSVIPTVDEGYLFTGRIALVGSQHTKGWFVKTDSSGEIMWTKTMGDSFSNIFRSARQTNDKGYILAGHTYSYGAGYADIWLVKTDSLGDTVWMKTFGDSITGEGASDVQLTTDSGYILCGDYWEKSAVLIKTDSFGNIGVKETSNIKTQNAKIEISQNPFIKLITLKYQLPVETPVSLNIYNASGTLVKTLVNEQKQPGIYSADFNAKGLPAGIYFAKFKAGDYKETKKLVLMK